MMAHLAAMQSTEVAFRALPLTAVLRDGVRWLLVRLAAVLVPLLALRHRTT